MPTIEDRVVDIQGLGKLRKDLKAMGPEFRKGLDDELKAAVKPIADEAKASYRRIHPKRSGGKGSQRGIRHSASSGRVRVILGGTRYPYLLGQEWGSDRFKFFPPATQRKPPKERGYFFWPAVVAGREELSKRIEAVVDKSISDNFSD